MWVFVLGILTLGYALLVLWYRSAWNQLSEFSPFGNPAQLAAWQPRTRVTVLIPARNEQQHIESCLESLAAQAYPYELLQIILLDDASEDDTALLVKKWTTRLDQLTYHFLPTDAAGKAHKKRAIEQGVSLATGELIVCTDADCTHHPHWLPTLVRRYEQGDVQFIAAPVVYQTEPNSLSVFQTLDFMMLQGITGASVSKRFHTMCNGANIAYTKKAFEEVGGFAGIDALPSGDDMLLMYKIYQRYPQGVVWLKSREAMVETHACGSWSEFFQQRIRWASKATHYDDRRIFWVLVLVYGFNVTIAASLLLLFVWPALGYAALTMLAVKTAVEWYFLQAVARFFKKEKWLSWFPFLQLHHVAYTIIAGWLGRFGSYRWKGRLVAPKKPEVVPGS
jgi:cellulose synthase/poly-beta-1,6-N-acetylglucosamine synthase-like glycosyltransferase